MNDKRCDVKQDNAGKYYLEVGGVAVAAEGDFCRDPRFNEPVWTRRTLELAASRIRSAFDKPLIQLH